MIGQVNESQIIFEESTVGSQSEAVLEAIRISDTETVIKTLMAGFDINYVFTKSDIEVDPVEKDCRDYQSVGQNLLERTLDVDELVKQKSHMVRLLLEQGAVCNKTKTQSDKILEAIRCGNVKVVQEILDSGFDPDYVITNSDVAMNKKEFSDNACRAIGKTLLTRVCQFTNNPEYNKKQLVETLLDAGASVITQADKNHPLHNAVRGLSYDAQAEIAFEIINILLDKDASVNSLDSDVFGFSPLELCIPSSNKHLTEKQLNLYLEAFKLILNNGCDINLRCDDLAGNTILHRIFNRKSPDVIYYKLASVILEKGMDVNVLNSFKQTPVCLIGYLTMKDVVFFKKYGAIFNKVIGGKNLLFNSPDLETARFLIEQGCNPKQKDEHGCTPLFSALNEDLVTFFIQYGCNPNKRGRRGDRPLHYFIRENSKGKNNYDKIEMLLMNGSNVNAINTYGDTALNDILGSTRHPSELTEEDNKTADLLVAHGAIREIPPGPRKKLMMHWEKNIDNKFKYYIYFMHILTSTYLGYVYFEKLSITQTYVL